jgi:hypothetical protein
LSEIRKKERARGTDKRERKSAKDTGKREGESLGGHEEQTRGEKESRVREVQKI